eukprot:scpid23367/ scgid4379/ Solute carrier family 15 member 4; Peptide transporter 4; Peptide/histidine transporter 1
MDGEAAPLLSPNVRRRAAAHGSSVRRCSPACKFHQSDIVLVVILLERLAAYSVTGNLVQFLEYRNFLDWSTTTATTAALLCSCLPKLGAFLTGFIADTRVGRYRMLVAALCVQLFGSVCLMTASFSEYCSGDHRLDVLHSFLILTGLVSFGIGIAMAMGTEIPLGLDQYAEQRQSYSQACKFFPKQYFCANAGGLVALTAVSIVQYNFLFGVGFAIPVVFYGVSIIVLLRCRKRLHVVTPRKPCPLSDVWQIMKQARRVKKTPRGEGSRNWLFANDFQPTGSWVMRAVQSLPDGRYTRNNVAYVQNFLAVVSVIVSTIFYQVTLSQDITTYTTQGNLMSLPVRHEDAPVFRNDNFCSLQWRQDGNEDSAPRTIFIPASVFTAVNPLTILLTIPLMQYLVYPIWKRLSQGVPISQLKRIGVGMMFAVLSVAMAYIVEVKRRQDDNWDFKNFTTTSSPDRTLPISRLSIFYQIPQYLFSGIAEVLVVVSVLDFAYLHAPPSLKGTCVGLVYSTMGLASLLSVAFLVFVKLTDSSLYYRAFTPTTTDPDVVRGHVHKFYVILLGTVGFGLFVFALMAQNFGIIPARAGIEDMVPVRNNPRPCEHGHQQQNTGSETRSNVKTSNHR